MPKDEEKIQSTGPHKKTLAGEPTKPVESVCLSSTENTFSAEKWRRDFEELVNRSMQKRQEQFNAIEETTRQLLAKMQAMQEMSEIWRQVDKRLKNGEWDKCRGLSREQQKEVLAQIYNEERVAKMQQDVLNKNKMEADWEEHRLRRIELIQWSKLPDKEKWLEFYNKPSPNINLSEGEDYARQTQAHPQTSEQQEKSAPQPESRPEATGQI